MKRTKEKINAFQGAITFVNFHSPKLAEDQNLLYSYAAWEPKIIVKNKNKNTSSSPAHTFLFLHTGSGGEDLDDLESCWYVFFWSPKTLKCKRVELTAKHVQWISVYPLYRHPHQQEPAVSDFISKHMYRLLREIFPCKTQDHILLLKKNKSHFQVHRWENQMWILDWEACKHDSRMRPQWLHATNVHSLYRDVPRIWLLFFLHLKLMVAVKLCSPGRSQNCKSVGLGNDIVHGEKQYSTDRNLKCTSLSPPSRMFFTTAACAAGSRSS